MELLVPPDDYINFELKRTATEVVRRSNSGLLSQQNSAWDIASAANDFSDDESAGGPRLGVEASLGRAGTSNTYTASRSMSNLRPAPAVAHPSGGSPRRPRKKWDMSGDAAGYASPLALQQQQQQAAIYGAYNGSPATNLPLPSGFMTMNGTHIYHSPSVVNRPAVDEMSSSVSMPGINQAARPQPSVVQSSSKGALGNLQTMGMVQGSGYMPPKPADLPLQQTLPGERKLSVPSHQSSPGDATFARTSPQRCSLTKRFMLSTPGATEPRTVWTPPAISTRRSASSMQYSTPQAGGASALIRRQSELPASGGRLYQQNTAGLGAMGSEEGGRSSRRARTMHRLKSRRMTIGAVEQEQTTNAAATANANLFTSPKEDDYATSDLHLRSRSQSPSQLALNALGDDYLHRAHRQARFLDSDMSVYSTVTMTSSRLTPASSRSNLRTIGTTNRQSSQAINKLNEMRDKLRKSQENLAGAIGDEAAGASTSLLMSRSRSIGNLRFSAALPVSGQRSDLASANYVAASTFPHDGSHMPGADSENKNDSSTLLSARSRYVARSVGNLHNNQDAADSAEDSSSTAHPYPPPRAPRRLAQTIESLKKASNPDLTQLVIGEDSIHAAGDLDTEAYYSSASLPRNQRGKGAVQKRVERYHPHSRVSRDTTSGESDSNASDANNSPLLQGAGIGGSQNVAKRYFSTVNGPNRSVSSMEGMPRPGMLQNARRIFEQQRHSSSNVPRRAPNYLAQKLAGGDIVGPDMGAEECPRQPVSPNEAATLPDFDTKSPQSKR
ncbi:unnamed protein product [Toxocara canis]|uniref:Protein kinase domain-containing protein n=1 Tax=Toxocara canis TaxID=6265 RepID=A0A183UKG7_TOXCA|nr:unnamed protein product [Toxocara canis]